MTVDSMDLQDSKAIQGETVAQSATPVTKPGPQPSLDPKTALNSLKESDFEELEPARVIETLEEIHRELGKQLNRTQI